MYTIALKVEAPQIGILVAVLALWAQLWFKYSVDDGKEDEIPDLKIVERQRVVSIGLVWIYISILFGIIAFIVSIINDTNAIRIDIGNIFFLTALLMGLTNIAESTVTLWWKVRSGKTHNSLIEGVTLEKYRESFCWLTSLVALTVLASVFAIVWSFVIGLIIWVITIVLGIVMLGCLKNKNEKG
jgi:hypothetical protein